MKLTAPLLVTLALLVAGCSSDGDTGLREFSDADPEYSKRRAKILCETRADRAAMEAAYRARREVRESGWSQAGLSPALADVEKRVYKSELRSCLAELGYYMEQEDL